MMPLDNTDESRGERLDHGNEVSNEWAIMAVYTFEDLNTLWSGHYTNSTSGLEKVHFKQTVSQGRQWEEGVVHLAGVSPSYSEANASVILNKRIVEDLRVMTWQEPGARGKVLKQLTRLNSAAQKELRLEVGLSSSYWHYDATDGGKLRLHWTTPPTFSVTGDDYLQSELEKYYTGIASIEMNLMSPPASAVLNEVWIQHEKNHHMVNFLVMDRQVDTSVRCQPLLEAPAHEIGADETEQLVAFSAHLFPEVRSHQPPADCNWVPRLFAPENSHHFSLGYYLPQADAYWALYAARASSRDLPRRGITAEQLVLNPLAKIVSAGDSGHGLSLSGSSSGAAWTLAGDALGKLEVNQSQYAYTPPQPLSPRAQLSDSSKTLQPAAYKTSAISPASTDIIRAVAGQMDAEAIFVTQYLVQTHFFKVARQGDNVSFSLCYVDRNGEEQVVPAANIKWHILAGNGTMSATGVFTPDPVSPTPCTVVMAEEYNDVLWFWALTVIPSPLFDSDAIVRFLDA